MGRVSQLTPPVKSISQVGLLIMLVSIFFLVFFASCIHVEARPNVGSMNVNMNDVDMNIGGGSGNGFDGNDLGDLCFNTARPEVTIEESLHSPKCLKPNSLVFGT